jgi:hypothetical protein
MLIYRGKLVSGPAALPRLVLRDLIYEKVLVGPVVPDFHGPVARLVELPSGGLRIDWWVKGSGWTEAPKGAFTLANFMPGYTRPASAKECRQVRHSRCGIGQRHGLRDRARET